MRKHFLIPKLTGPLYIPTTNYTVLSKHVTSSQQLIMTSWLIIWLMFTNTVNINVKILIATTLDFRKEIWICIEKCIPDAPIKISFTNAQHRIAFQAFHLRNCWSVICVFIITISICVSIAPIDTKSRVIIDLTLRSILELRTLLAIDVTKNSRPYRNWISITNCTKELYTVVNYVMHMKVSRKLQSSIIWNKNILTF